MASEPSLRDVAIKLFLQIVSGNGLPRVSGRTPSAEGQPHAGLMLVRLEFLFEALGKESESRTETSTRSSGLILPARGERADTTWRFVMKIERTSGGVG